jgi:hypothetical protein
MAASLTAVPGAGAAEAELSTNKPTPTIAKPFIEHP